MVYYLITCHFEEIVFVENSELDGLCPRTSIYKYIKKLHLKITGLYLIYFLDPVLCSPCGSYSIDMTKDNIMTINY